MATDVIQMRYDEPNGWHHVQSSSKQKYVINSHEILAVDDGKHVLR